MGSAGQLKRRQRTTQPTASGAGGTHKSNAIEVPDSPILVQSGPSDDEFEEVTIPVSAHINEPSAWDTPVSPHRYHDSEEGDSEEDGDEIIRVEIGGETEEEKAKRIELEMRKKPMTAKDRALRLEIHKMHVISLLASARIRNHWASNELLQARLLSLLPHELQAAFSISPKRFPDKAQRSRLFLNALQSLVSWWTYKFFDAEPESGLRTRTWDSVQEVIDEMPRLTRADILGGWCSRPDSSKVSRVNGRGRAKPKQEDDPVMSRLAETFKGERLRTVNSVMKKALQQEGSRDISALLFVALARACGLGARLVVNVQAVPWRAEKPSSTKRKGRSKASRQGMGPDGAGSEENELEEVPIPNPVDPYRLRASRPTPRTIGNAGTSGRAKREETVDPPVFWAEVYSRVDRRWIPVDPLNAIIRKKAGYMPLHDADPVRMAYVVAFEEDGYARDVTLRYATNFNAKTSKLRPPPNKDGSDWWSDVVSFLRRPVPLNRDELEDAELEMNQASEGMPVQIGGFKDHPTYVLERHLKQTEVIKPKREVGRFKGEAVYRRRDVLACKTAENWMRMGRKIKAGQDPLKWIKQRAVTLQKRRAQELAAQEGQEPMQQGLYAENQTELFIPPPIVGGRIPQNSFGNIDLYVPTMLPSGASHLPYKGIAKVAKQLGVSYAEAVTSFEFKKQRAAPVLTGIVVAEEEKETVMKAYWKSTAAAEEREKARREDRALKRWAKLINGMRVRQRLQQDYGTSNSLNDMSRNPMADATDNRTATAPSASSIIARSNEQQRAAWDRRVRSHLPSPSPDEEEEVLTEVGQSSEDEASAVEEGPTSATNQTSNKSASPKDVLPEEEDDPPSVPLNASGRPRRGVSNPAPAVGVPKIILRLPARGMSATRGRAATLTKAGSQTDSQGVVAQPPVESSTRVLRSRVVKK